MGQIYDQIMQTLYGADIWAGYEPINGDDNVEGWNGNHPSLSRLAASPGAKVVMDVGVWKGQSTINLARSMKNNQIDGVVIAIDTFLGSPENWETAGIQYDRIHGRPNLYDIFLTNVFRSDLTNYIIPMPQTSTTAVQVLTRLNIRPDLVHVDAAHEYREVLRDAEDYWALLKDGGYMIGDDYHITHRGVVQAVGEFSAKVRRPLIIEVPKWIMEK